MMIEMALERALEKIAALEERVSALEASKSGTNDPVVLFCLTEILQRIDRSLADLYLVDKDIVTFVGVLCFADNIIEKHVGVSVFDVRFLVQGNLNEAIFSHAFRKKMALV